VGEAVRVRLALVQTRNDVLEATRPCSRRMIHAHLKHLHGSVGGWIHNDRKCIPQSRSGSMWWTIKVVGTGTILAVD
jgi:hypothetical protein